MTDHLPIINQFACLSLSPHADLKRKLGAKRAQSFYESLLFPLLFFISFAAFSQDRIRGKVSNTQGFGLQGATILVAGTNNYTVTDSSGSFTLAARQGDKIQISYIGYDPYEVVLKDETKLDIFLTESLRMLDEVVVVGYGSVPRGDVTGAVASISEHDFIQGNVTTSLQQIQGKIPGVVITQPGGDPNGDFNVRIRGATSLEGQPPLLVIDGVAIDDFHRAITTLNPADVASYDVLKDAAAAAIYGSRGANGVILVTTKKGKTGNVIINYGGYGSVETISNKFDVLSAQKWRDYTANDPNAAAYDMGANTDWQDEVTRTAYTQSHTISASGGNDQIRLRASVGYINQPGIVLNTGKEVLTARLNTDLSTKNKKFNISYGVNTSVINRDMLPDQNSTAQSRQGGAWVFSWAQGLLPVWPVYNPDGSYFISPSDFLNPVPLLENLNSKQKQNFFQTSLRGDFELIDGLKLGAMAALSNGNDVYSRYWPPFPGTDDLGWGGRTNSNKQNFTGDLHINFRKELGEHLIDVTGVYEYNNFKNDGFGAFARGTHIEGLILPDNLSGAISVTPADISSFRNEDRIISFLGRLIYSYRDRYILTANFRRDGSSKFGVNNRWGNFPSASFAWRVTNESFMAGVSWMDLKLRASYGLTGNQENLPSNLYQNMYSAGGPYYLNGHWGQSVGVLTEGNPDLKWEVRKSFNIGLDFSLWRDRINGTVDVFSDKTSDMLFLYNVPQPPFVNSQAYANAADATNKGIEAAIAADVLNKKDFVWNVRVNVGAVRNRITNLLGQFKGFDLSVTNAHYGWAYGGSFQATPVTELKEGYPAGVFWLPKHSGVLPDGNELFLIRNNEGTLVDSTGFKDSDRIYIDPTPDFEWGITNTITYRSFDLSIFVRGVQGSKIFANSLLNLGSTAYLPATNVTEEALTNGFTNKPNISTYWLHDASFARLENVTLGYTLNNIRGITRLRVYIAGKNLLLITKYKGIDPEVNVEGGQRYIDQSIYPRTRSFTIGLDLSF